MRPPLLRATGVIAGCVLAITASSGAVARLARAANTVCGPSSARTVAADSVARVYSSGGDVYGCIAGVAHNYRLGAAGPSIRAAQVESVRVAGELVAYGLRTSGVDTGLVTVNIRSLATGKVLARRAATTKIGVEGFESVDSLVLKDDGAVAWIATAHSIGSPTFIRQVARLDKDGFRVLDSGPSVADASLALRGSTLSWKHGSAVRTAALR